MNGARACLTGWLAAGLSSALTALAVSFSLAMAGSDAARAEPSQGRTLYIQHCASCHGAQLEGQPNWKRLNDKGRRPAPPHDETGHTWHHPMEQLLRITKLGFRPPLVPEGYESDMPGFEGVLTDAEMRTILRYIKSTWPEKIRDRHDKMEEAGKQ